MLFFSLRSLPPPRREVARGHPHTRSTPQILIAFRRKKKWCNPARSLRWGQRSSSIEALWHARYRQHGNSRTSRSGRTATHRPSNSCFCWVVWRGSTLGHAPHSTLGHARPRSTLHTPRSATLHAPHSTLGDAPRSATLALHTLGDASTKNYLSNPVIQPHSVIGPKRI